jgi:hypothetical protein
MYSYILSAQQDTIIYSKDTKKVVFLTSTLVGGRHFCPNYVISLSEYYKFPGQNISLSCLVTSLRWMNGNTSVTAAYHFISTLPKKSSVQ